MAQIAFHVPGAPRGKGRPRMTRSGHTYTPAETARYENLVRLVASSAMQGASLWDVPVRVSMVVVTERPKSHYRSGAHAHAVKLSAPVHCCRAPDLDNVAKIICDACNGIVYRDDRQIVSLHCERQWAGEYTQAGVYAQMTTVENVDG